MWHLIKNEIKYSYSSYFLIAIIALFYTIYILLGHPFMTQEEVTTRIFWPFLVGLVPLLIIAQTWLYNNIIEKHVRFLSLLPVSIKKISIVRVLNGLIALIILVLYYFLIHSFFILEWEKVIKSLFYLLGANSLIIATVLLVYDFHLCKHSKFNFLTVFTGLIFILAIGIIGFVFERVIISSMNLEELKGIIFLILAIFILGIDKIIYQKRQTYLL